MTKWVALVALLIPLASRAEADKKTEKTWKAKCASCHGADGKGKTESGEKMGVVDLTSADAKKKTDEQLKDAITNGAKGKGDAAMEGYKDKLSAEEIDKLVAHVRSLK